MRFDKRAIVLCAVIFAALAVGCGPSAEVPSASCSVCMGSAYTAADCAAFAAASHCASSSIGAGPAGCINQCNFTDCDSPPECRAAIVDAGTADMPPDPLCSGATGLFSSCDLCPGAGCHEVMIGGVTQYTCACGTCPCGFVCGSIPAPGGGVLSSVCAPP